jgi:hypothetical protein
LQIGPTGFVMMWKADEPAGLDIVAGSISRRSAKSRGNTGFAGLWGYFVDGGAGAFAVGDGGMTAALLIRTRKHD